MPKTMNLPNLVAIVSAHLKSKGYVTSNNFEEHSISVSLSGLSIAVVRLSEDDLGCDLGELTDEITQTLKEKSRPRSSRTLVPEDLPENSINPSIAIAVHKNDLQQKTLKMLGKSSSPGGRK